MVVVECMFWSMSDEFTCVCQMDAINDIYSSEIVCSVGFVLLTFFFNDTTTTEIYTGLIVGSVRCV